MAFSVRTSIRVTFFGLLAIAVVCCVPAPVGSCVATVIRPSVNGKRCIVEYRVNDRRYTVPGPRHRYLAKGEKFQLLYRVNDPWYSRVLLEAPVFVEHEKTVYAEGKIIRCVNGSFSKVLYQYEVNGVSYKKLQVLEGVSGLHKKETCLVKYAACDPSRAILVGNKSYRYCISQLLASSSVSKN